PFFPCQETRHILQFALQNIGRALDNLSPLRSRHSRPIRQGSGRSGDCLFRVSLRCEITCAEDFIQVCGISYLHCAAFPQREPFTENVIAYFEHESMPPNLRIDRSESPADVPRSSSSSSRK